MELYHLQTFVVVAEEQSITRAARRLHTAASTISMHIKALEDETGVQLFTRSTRGMLITPGGETLLEKATQTLNMAQAFVNQAADLRQTLTGTISLGLNSSPGVLHIPELISAARENYPGLELALQQATTAQIIEAVAGEQLDLGFVYGAVNHPLLHGHPLKAIDLVVVIPAGWPAKKLSDWDDLATQTWISVGENCPFHSILCHHLDLQNKIAANIVQVDDDRSRYDLVAAGVGLSLLERDYALQGVQRGEMTIAGVDSFACDLALICRIDREKQPLVRCVVQLIAELFANTAGR